MFALTSGSTIMFKFVENGDDECPFAIDNVVVKVIVDPAFCCAVERLNVFDLSTLVSPADPDPMFTV